MAVTIYRVIDLSPPHASGEFAAPSPSAALALFGVDPDGITEEPLDARVSRFSLSGDVAWLTVVLREQE